MAIPFDEDKMGQLFESWKEGGWIRARRMIFELLGLEVADIAGHEETLLYGAHYRDNEVRNEHYCGRLIGVLPGVVMLDPTHITTIDELAGLMERYDQGGYAFQLRPFRKVAFVDLRIVGLSERYPSQLRAFPGCSHVIFEDLDRDQGSSWGINPARWEIMRKFLDKWLPAE